jgi:hypothetical protein
LLEDRAGTLWVAAGDAGLLWMRRGAESRPESVIPRLHVSALLEDREGTLWLGTDGQGLIQLIDPRVRAWGGAGHPLEVPVRAVLPDEDGFWAATYGKGLARVTPAGVEFPWADSPLADHFALSLHRSRDGSLWVGTLYGAVIRHTLAGTTFYATFTAPARPILVLTESPTGGLWVGTEEGLWTWEPGTTPDCVPGTEGRTIYCLISNGDAWWAGSDDSVLLVDRAGARPLKAAGSELRGAVRALFADARGAVWIGTYGGGLYRWRDGVLFAYGTSAGLTDPTVSFLAGDAHGRLWMTGNRGVVEAPLAQLDAVAEGRRASVQVHRFSEDDGMPTRECNGGSQPAGALASDGTLLVPTIRGVAAIPTRHRPSPMGAMPLYIEEVRVDDRPAAGGEEIVIPPGSHRIEIRYAALRFAAPSGLCYSIRMEGRDPDWVEVGSRTAAYYSDLPPGRYTFRVRAEEADGWRSEASLSIRHLPLFTQTPGFIALCVAAGLAVLGAVFWARTRALHAIRRRLARQVQERTDELERLHALTATINEAVLPEEVLDHIYQSFRALVPFDRLLFATIDDRGRRLRIQFARDPAGPAASSGTAFQEAGPVLDLCAGSKAMLLADCSTVPEAIHPFPRHPGGCSTILVPLRTRHGLLGALLLSRPHPHAFDATHVERVDRIARHLSTIIEKSRLYEEVLRLSELKERFFGMAAHDLRHPLGALVLYCSLLEMESAEGLEAAVKAHLPAMKNACASMGRLINDLLDYQVLEDGQATLHLQARDPAALTREIQADLTLLARQKAIKLTLRLPESAPPIPMDPLRIRQVLDNLVSNAAKYSDPGSEVVLGLEAGEGLVRWWVSDAGVGIVDQDRPRLFQPFVKGLRRPTSGEKSIGLGLALCKRIVEAHGGTIGFEDRPGGGTTFMFTLPAPPPAP